MAKQKIEKEGIDKIIADLEKKHGLSKGDTSDNIIVSTGSIQLNEAMGVGGTILGKMYEIFGANSSGKSTTVLHQIAEYQKTFPLKKCALFDFEHAFDKKYAQNLNVDTNNLLLYQPNSMEQGYNMILSLIESEIVSLVVIDSQSAATPQKIIDNEIGEATMGLQARFNSTFCQKVKGMLSNHKVSLIFVSQTRSNIGGMSSEAVTTGGEAIKFYSDVRWKVWKSLDKINELNKTTIDVIKNKLASPFGQAKINIIWGKGFDTIGELIDYGVEFDFIKKGGAWLTYKDVKLQGTEKLKAYFDENPKQLLHLKQNVMLELSEAKQLEEEEAIIQEEVNEIEVNTPEILEKANDKI